MHPHFPHACCIPYQWHHIRFVTPVILVEDCIFYAGKVYIVHSVQYRKKIQDAKTNKMHNAIANFVGLVS